MFRLNLKILVAKIMGARCIKVRSSDISPHARRILESKGYIIYKKRGLYTLKDKDTRVSWGQGVRKSESEKDDKNTPKEAKELLFTPLPRNK